MSGRRLGVYIAAAGLAAGLILALVPTRHTYPAGVRGKGVGFVEAQSVSCGSLFFAKRPTVRGYDNECDHEQNVRWVIAFFIVVSGLLIGGIAFAVSMIRNRRGRSGATEAALHQNG
jgi:hypothetical protein